jgi:benzoyl-CoA reductase subunit C
MEEVLGEFSSIVENPYAHLAEWKKESGVKVIGCFPMHIPEEIIHAAGMLPVTLLGSGKPITLAGQYVHPYICQLVLGNFDLSLNGDLDFLDGVVFSDFCLTVQMISDIWIHHKPAGFYHQLILPKNMRADYTERYIERQFLRLRTALAQLSGQDISDSSLAKSIAIYNENRRLLHRLYRMRRAHPGLFRARDVATIVAAGMLMPKEEHSRLLSQYLEQVEKTSSPPDGKIRLILSGYLCDLPELDVLDLVEDLGAVISDDDLYAGRRYFQTLTDESLSPLAALAQRYIDDVPCPTKLDAKQDWSEYLAGLVKEATAAGVISVSLKYCEAHLYDFPVLTKNLSQKGIPHFMIETSHRGATGQLRTRIEAFLETL